MKNLGHLLHGGVQPGIRVLNLCSKFIQHPVAIFPNFFWESDVFLCVTDPDPGPGIGCVFDPGIRDGLKKDPDPGWISRIIFPRAKKQFFWVRNTKILWCGSGIFLTLDPGWKYRIRDNHTGYRTQHWFCSNLMQILIQIHKNNVLICHGLTQPVHLARCQCCATCFWTELTASE